MKILLDTQIALWAWSEHERIPEKIRTAISSPANDVFFSQVSTWEIQIKYGLGKLPFPDRPERIIPAALQKSNFNSLNIQDAAIFFLDRLPTFHRDPFDRLLIAHAIIGNYHLATVDPLVEQYPVQLLS